MPPSQLSAARARLEGALKGDGDLDSILTRFDRWGEDLLAGLIPIYGDDSLNRAVDVIATIFKDRTAQLRKRDEARVLQPDWFQLPDAVGYVCYTDLFAGDLQGIRKKIDYLKSLGVTYLHLMPLLTPRPGANDGGYAVMDYRSVRSDLGTMKDLEELSADLHAAGISLTLDLVLNHVAKEHEWAMRAKKGEAKYKNYFYTYPDRSTPDEYEKTLPEIFPAFAPGNFTFNEEMKEWVWTTFNEYQWDVNWSNIDVFVEYAEVIGYLANRGADCVRLDAIAFIWKRLGTNSQNQPEVHFITQALRAIAHIACPSLIFKAEAIVGPKDVVHYLGQGDHAGKVSDLAYHNSLMVQIWSAIASRNGKLLAHALSKFAPIPTTSTWGTYLRCHDDIGWAIDDEDAGQLGIDPYAHRGFLADFYANEFSGSFARGVHFQSNPTTGDRRTSGSAASLSGIESALQSNNEPALATAIDRLLASYAIVFGFGGIPLIYMGDELGMLNDHSFENDPTKAEDNRWIHRPAMDWKHVESALAGKGVEGKIFSGFETLVRARKSLAALHAATSPIVSVASNHKILLITRKHASGTVVQIYNLSEETQVFNTSEIGQGIYREHISGRIMNFEGLIKVPPYAYWWLIQ
jgi:amylosucrase